MRKNIESGGKMKTANQLKSLIMEAETVSSLMQHLADNDIDSDSFAVMCDLGENGQEHECDLPITETALRASSVIDALLATLRELELKPISTSEEHTDALRMIEKLLANAPSPDSPDGKLLEVMIMLVEGYENRHYPILPVSPLDAIKFRMNEQGLSVEDLAPAIGDVQRAKDVLSGSRALTLPMIRRLHRQFGIPLESLVGV